MTDLKHINIDKQINGSIDSLLEETATSMKINLDRDKFDFLKIISKTQYSGYTLKNLTSTLKFLQNKDEDWFREIVKDGLVETFNFKNPNGKYDVKWEGYFITTKGRQVIKGIMNKI